jgi:pimeloyl-ACP methyl ester carboxylesterase
MRFPHGADPAAQGWPADHARGALIRVLRKAIAWLALVAGLLAIVYLLVRTPDIPADEARAKYGNAESQLVEVSPDFRVHVRDEGSGPALLLIHGSNASLHTWEPWVALLKDRYRVVTLDLQGHGLTGPIPSRCYSRECMVETVESVRAKLGIERLAIGGNSMGGAVSWAYALAHPERVSALILVDSAGAQVKAERPPPIGFRILQMPGVRNLAETITPRSLVESSLLQSVSVKSAASDEKVTRYWELLRYPGNRRATLDRSQAPRTPVSLETFAPLRDVPTLILWGREDKLFAPAAAEWFQRALPNAKLIIYDGIGHLPQEEAPERSAEDVAAFLGGISPPAEGAGLPLSRE